MKHYVHSWLIKLLYGGKLSQDKTFTNWWKISVSWRKLSQIACCCHQIMPLPNFAGETFANSHNTSKFAKVSFFESFPLYGILQRSLAWLISVTGSGHSLMHINIYSYIERLGERLYQCPVVGVIHILKLPPISSVKPLLDSPCWYSAGGPSLLKIQTLSKTICVSSQYWAFVHDSARDTCYSQPVSHSYLLLIVPAVPSTCNITLSYNQSSGRLQFINSTWDTVPVSDRA